MAYDALPVEVSYSGPKDGWRAEVPAEAITALLAAFDGRRRAFLVALLNGKSRTMAAACIGVTPRCVQQWTAKEPAFAEAVEAAAQTGFAAFEVELQNRALAGSGDRGSMRALELVLKHGDASYRDGARAATEVVHRAEAAMAAVVSDWSPTARG